MGTPGETAIMPLQYMEHAPTGTPALFPPQSSHVPGECMSLDAATAILAVMAEE